MQDRRMAEIVALASSEEEEMPKSVDGEAERIMIVSDQWPSYSKK